MVTPTCAGCDKSASQFHGFACDRCAYRLPPRMKEELQRSRDNYPATHRLAVEEATEWLRRNPWREPPKPPKMTPEEEAEVRRFLEDAYHLLNGTGDHASHTRKQVGRCVYCSCGKRVQGRMGGAT